MMTQLQPTIAKTMIAVANVYFVRQEPTRPTTKRRGHRYSCGPVSRVSPGASGWVVVAGGNSYPICPIRPADRNASEQEPRRYRRPSNPDFNPRPTVDRPA